MFNWLKVKMGYLVLEDMNVLIKIVQYTLKNSPAYSNGDTSLVNM